jgi:hypothetical protein
MFRMTVRLPADLYRAIVEMAQREDRSVHGQIIHLLRKALADVRGV